MWMPARSAIVFISVYLRLLPLVLNRRNFQCKHQSVICLPILHRTFEQSWTKEGAVGRLGIDDNWVFFVRKTLNNDKMIKIENMVERGRWKTKTPSDHKQFNWENNYTRKSFGEYCLSLLPDIFGSVGKKNAPCWAILFVLQKTQGARSILFSRPSLYWSTG